MKTKKLSLLLLSIFLLQTVKAQTIKLENGIAISSLKNHNKNLFENKITPYNLSLQVDYLDHSWFYLSSAVGYLQKGGKDDFKVWMSANEALTDKDPTLRINYLTINTLFNWKYKLPFETHTLCFYLGAGPRIDISTNYFHTPKEINEFFKNGDFYKEQLKTEKIVYGIKCATGLLYDLNKDIQLGLNFSWLPSFNKPFKNADTKEKTFTLGVSIGYIL